VFGEIRGGVRRLMRLAIRSPRLAPHDAADELHSVFSARQERLRALGYSPDAARAEAARRMGGTVDEVLDSLIQSAEHRERTMSARERISELASDFRQSFRGLRRDPLFTGFVIITLALGIGANAAMFGVASRLLLRAPEHIVQPDRVNRLFMHYRRANGEEVNNANYGWVVYDMLRTQSRSFAGVAAYSIGGDPVPFGRGSGAELVAIGAVSYDFFPLLGVRPEVGRFFDAAEDDPFNARHVAVIGHALWMRTFGGDRAVIGKPITVADVQYTVVGVAPPGFTGPALSRVDVWYPMSIRSQGSIDNWTKGWNGQWLQILVRLKDGVSGEAAADDAGRIFRAGYGGKNQFAAKATMTLASLRSTPSGKEPVDVTVSRWLVGVAAIVLLVACANVANLLLARAARRRRELAVRAALGSGRGRLMRLVFAECFVLAVAGAVAGLFVAAVLTGVIRSVLLTNIEWTSGAVGWPVLIASAATVIIVTLLIGLAPALRAGGSDLIESLKAGSRESGGQTSRLRASLTIGQAAVSVVLLVGAGLFVRSLVRIQSLDLGVQPDRVLVTGLRYPSNANVQRSQDSAEVARRAAVLVDVMNRARALPGVEHASIAIGLPFQYSFGQSLRVPGWDSIPQLTGGNSPLIFAVGPDYFETVGGHVLEGREFTAADRKGTEPVAIVNQTMAKVLYRGSPVGQCLYWGRSDQDLNTCSRIIGVVADMHQYRMKEDPSFAYYIPLGQERGFGGSKLVVRPAKGFEAQVTNKLREMILSTDPQVTFVRTTLLQDEVDPQIRPWKLGAAVFTMLGALAVLVAAVGLYSVMSYLVAQRGRELAVRIAMGARAESIVALILRSGVGMVAVGVIIGLTASLWAGRFLAPLLFETSPRDPAVLGAVALMLIVVGVMASVIPAARAARVNPAEALRSE
jgi:predicted permease